MVSFNVPMPHSRLNPELINVSDEQIQLFIALTERSTNLEEQIYFAQEFVRLGEEKILSKIYISEAYANTLATARDDIRLIAFAERFQEKYELMLSPRLVVAYAWALLNTGKAQKAQNILEKVVQVSNLEKHTLALAWQRLMLSRYFCNKDNWQEARIQYRIFATEYEYGQGLLLEGFIYHKEQRFSEARQCYREALPYLKNNVFHYARAHYNLGMLDLLECNPDSIRHLEIARQNACKHGGKRFLATALAGLGAAYRVSGHWQATETAYLRAIEAATEDRDYRQAYLNLARTYRLQQRTHEALELLIFAAAYLPTDLDEVQLEQAAAYLLEHNPDLARKNLQGIRVGGADIWLAQILTAELERRAGNLTAMLEALQNLPMQSRLAREEARVFPELFATAAKLGMETPEPLPEARKICIKAKVVGVLEVLVDEQPLELDAVCLGAQVLVYLIEHQHSCTTEELVNAIWFDLPRDKYHSKRRQVWQAVKRLNKIMPINEAVETDKSGVYRLSKHLEWQTDLAGHQQVKAYLTGMHSHWIDQKRRQLGLEKLPS